MNEQSPICQECPVKNDCLLEKKSEKLANAIIYEDISDEDSRSQLSTLKKIANTYNCPLEERKRLIKPFDERINPNRTQVVITRSDKTGADRYIAESALAFRANRNGMKSFKRGRQTVNGARD